MYHKFRTALDFIGVLLVLLLINVAFFDVFVLELKLAALFVILTFYWVFVLTCAHSASARRFGPVDDTQFRADDYIKRDNSDTLVVILHGLDDGSHKDHMLDLKNTVERSLPNADVLVPRFNASPYANVLPKFIANDLCNCLNQCYQNKKYEHIILVGYSLGALLVRKAFVYGCGRRDDLSGADIRSEMEWVSKVDRFVLVAGINRGWSLSPRPEQMGFFMHVFLVLGSVRAKLAGFGQLLLGVERGSPFVSNLRIQWLDLQSGRLNEEYETTKESDDETRLLRLYRKLVPSPKRQVRPFPEVIQLLGDTDSIVSAADSKDVAASPRFIFIPVPHADHFNAASFPKTPEGQGRESYFIEALTKPIADLRERYAEKAEIDPDIHKVTEIVFIMHGIRDLGNWMIDLSSFLHKAHEALYPKKDQLLKVVTAQYGYFPMIAFIMPFDRQKKVKWFLDQYTETRAKYINASQYHYIGHSNGTFLLASGLQNYQALKIHRVVFAGSVVPRDYPWGNFTCYDRVAAVKNYVGSADWVVGIFPGFFEWIKDTFSFRAFGCDELGSAGFNGFLYDKWHKSEVRYLNGGHGIALEKFNQQSIADFILRGEDLTPPAGPSNFVPDQDAVVSFLARFSWLVFFLLFVIAFLLMNASAVLTLLFFKLLASLSTGHIFFNVHAAVEAHVGIVRILAAFFAIILILALYSI